MTFTGDIVMGRLEDRKQVGWVYFETSNSLNINVFHILDDQSMRFRPDSALFLKVFTNKL